MTNTPYITCKELYEFLDDYTGGTLTNDQRLDFDRHLGACPSCVAYLDGYLRTIALSKQAFDRTEKSAASKAPKQLLEAIRAARQRPTS